VRKSITSCPKASSDDRKTYREKGLKTGRTTEYGILDPLSRSKKFLKSVQSGKTRGASNSRAKGKLIFKSTRLRGLPKSKGSRAIIKVDKDENREVAGYSAIRKSSNMGGGGV